MKKAEKQQNAEEYFEALNGFLVSIHDGHVSLTLKSLLTGLNGRTMAKSPSDNIPNYMLRHWSEGFGMALTPLANNSVIVSILQPKGPAAKAGIKLGARIIAWDGKPIKQAVKKVSLIWNNFDNTPATVIGKTLEQYRFLTFALKGTPASVTFLNPGSSKIQTANFKADVIGMDILNATSLGRRNDPSGKVEYRILASGYGYLKINSEMYEGKDMTKSPQYLELTKAINLFNQQGVPGVIVDLRGNTGGNAFLNALMAGFFYQKSSFYAYISFYNTLSHKFEIWRPYNIYVTPQQPNYAAPIIVLTDLGTVSSGKD